MKLVAKDMLGMVLTYLEACGFHKAAEHIKKKSDFTLDEVAVQSQHQQDNPINGLSLMKVMKEYLTVHPEQCLFVPINRIIKAIRKYKKRKTSEVSPVLEESSPPEEFIPEKKGPYKRIDEKIIEELPTELQDNSFQTKFKHGQGDLYGIEGYQRLKGWMGKDYRKEKSRFKKKSFQGGKVGKIVYGVNSTKFN
eukprot:TRINITY_DN65237_c0_g1_i1.p7 TRINITY_DN65237_c0_g1~~TRINITY_DN65237_c0_g1_i1.p7  ORF type:complete len:194 (+),score=29.09 TRINITY_DN65237_c0_g1_i1:1070-1651(+)